MSESLFEEASKHSFYNFDEVIKSQYAGCYYCMKCFPTNLINEEDHCIASTPHGTLEPTVFCPFCKIDAVIGDASGYHIQNIEFLKYMNSFAFQIKK